MATISIQTEKGEVKGYLAHPEGNNKYPAIILIHEVWGLNDHIKDVANRFANEGYLVFAPDLLSETGILDNIDQSIMAEVANPATRDEAQKKMRAAMAPIQAPEFAKDTIVKLQGCFNFLKNHELSNGEVSVIGFCFGGTYAYNLAIHQPSLACAVPFYGHAPNDEAELSKISCPILAFYGEQDKQLVDQLPKLNEVMGQLGKDFEYVVYPDTGHAFFNDTNKSRYNKAAADDAWAKTLGFLESHT